MAGRESLARFIFPLFVAALVFFAVTYFARHLFEDRDVVTLEAPEPAQIEKDLLAYERNTIEVFQAVSPAVVFVHNLQNYRSFFSRNVTEVQKGTGSGFLWDSRGHIVTNYHVVAGADRVAVTLIDGNTYRARIVGVEPRKDLAVLKIDLRETNVAPLSEKVADSSNLMEGQKAIAIGNPYGLDHTLTVGIVSAIGRSTASVVEGITIRDMIQTDAAINPGNSGGPLLDSQGRLIGMNTLILRNSTGIGFAVPSNTIRRTVNQVIRYGQALQSGIGISIFEDRIARSIGVDGVIIREVYGDSPAEKAGVRGTAYDSAGRIILGDIILSINGQRVRNYDDMYNAFDEIKPGETVDIIFFRDGEEVSKTIEVVIVSE